MIFKYVRHIITNSLTTRSLMSYTSNNSKSMETKVANNIRQLDLKLPELQTLLSAEVKWLCNLFIFKGYEIRVIGGAVRDTLMSKTPKDIDLSTTAKPNEMIELFEENNIRYIETGLQHGTLSVHLDERDYEVTTLRIDVETYGRLAKVEFTHDWYLDAERRDLTVNAMSIDINGLLCDYFNGEDDLKAGKIRFVGDAEKRIREDYLRILRYFRFYGKIAPDIYQHNKETLNVIATLAPGLRNIAVERIWVEVNKILVGPYAPHLIRLMYDHHVAGNIGLPSCSNQHFEEFQKVWSHTQDLNPLPATLLVTLVSTTKQAETLSLSWKLSNNDKNLMIFLADHRYKNTDLGNPIRYYQDILVTQSNPANLHIVRMHVLELLKYECRLDLLKTLTHWDVPKFPITGGDLKTKGIRPGKEMGKIINTLKVMWVESYYELSKQYLLEKVDELVKK